MLAFKDHECVGVNIGNYNSGVGSTGGGCVVLLVVWVSGVGYSW